MPRGLAARKYSNSQQLFENVEGPYSARSTTVHLGLRQSCMLLAGAGPGEDPPTVPDYSGAANSPPKQGTNSVSARKTCGFPDQECRGRHYLRFERQSIVFAPATSNAKCR